MLAESPVVKSWTRAEQSNRLNKQNRAAPGEAGFR